ncbi:MAG: TcdA/TcdB catalytic glycosyltransferase domain-containing protein [Spiroplasma sp.]|nr:TcdA/TcdB catalytic glycosyltransferase domain-containing protein [Spiroplasma sp.]
MPNQKKEQLKKLQAEKERLIYEIKTGISNNIKRIYNQRIINIQNEMAVLNKLDDSEKNIHVVWIGIPPKTEFDNLKLWTKYNPDYKIHIWIDTNHILSHKLGQIIFENSNISKNGITKHDYQLEANLKDDFYNNYQLKNQNQSFDSNAKQFLLTKKYASITDIANWINEGKTKILQEQTDIKKYTNNDVILHDINQEKNAIFPNEKYYHGYLQNLEHLHICAGASNRLRYAILNKLGGVYLDTNLMMKFNLKNIKNNKIISKLINSIEWDPNDNQFNQLSEKKEIVLNQIIHFNQLNKLENTNLTNFNKNWEKIFKTKFDKNIEILKELVQKIKNMNLNLKPIIPLSKFPIDNFLQTMCYEKNNQTFNNALIISKKDSKLLQEIMKKIEITDKKTKDMTTYKKLINKDMMILYHTGAANFYYTMMENEENYFYQRNKNCSKLINEFTVDNFDSNWRNKNILKDALQDEEEIRFLFLNHTRNFKIPNYNQRPEIIKIKQELEAKSLIFEENQKLWNDDSFWFVKIRKEK